MDEATSPAKGGIGATGTVHPVDEIVPLPKLAALGIQHVLVMYAGAVIVPLIIGRALKLETHQIVALVNMDLFACGIATLIQSFGFKKWVGIRLPVMMGVTFASVSPMLAMITAGAEAGVPKLETLNTIYGSVIAAGIFGVIVSPFISRMVRFFPPVVTGSIILIIGVSLMRVGINWAAGASVDTLPGYGDPINLAIAGCVLLVVLVLIRYSKGFLSNIAVLLGIVVGAGIAIMIGKMTFEKIGQADWFGLVLPFAFGAPIFNLSAIVTMCLIMTVVMIESLGMFLALGTMTGKKLSRDDLTRGFRADGVGTIIGGIFNTFPYTSFSQNVGLVAVTGVRSRWVTVAGGVFLLLLGLIPKLAQVVESVPLFVLGGAGIVMFGMVAATGIRILTRVDFANNRNNLYVVALSIGFGMIPLVAPKFFQHMPKLLSPMLHSGILITAVLAVVLNVYFNGVKDQSEAEQEAAESSHGSE